MQSVANVQVPKVCCAALDLVYCGDVAQGYSPATLMIKPYNKTFANRSAMLVAYNDTNSGVVTWVPVNIAQGSSKSSIDVDLTPLAGHKPVAIRYAWGSTGAPNGDDVVCCEL